MGKTYVVNQLAKSEFKQFVEINFELEPEYKNCFETLKPDQIVQAIELLRRVDIKPGETLLFLDEVQDCPNAIRALRCFKEKMPDLHVIAAGSLLEFALDQGDLRMPVGRVQYMYLKPLSFCEFLNATGGGKLRDFIDGFEFGQTINSAVHEQLLQLVRVYNVLGGMPETIAEYQAGKSFQRCFDMQTALLKTYRDDFGKYTQKVTLTNLQKIFGRIPGLTAQHFKYVNVEQELRAIEIRAALDLLEKAGLIYFCYYTAAKGLPLSAFINEKRFKLLFLDVGLVTRLSDLNVDKILKEDLLLANRGALAEQFVAQELLAYQSVFDEGSLFYWEGMKPQSIAELDYMMCFDGQIIPVEVKAGTTGRLKSLKQFLEKNKLPLGVRLSQLPLGFEENILTVPFYLISRLEYLLNHCLPT